MIQLLKLLPMVIWYEAQVKEGTVAGIEKYERNIHCKDNEMLVSNIDSLQRDKNSFRMITQQFKTKLKALVHSWLHLKLLNS